MAYPVLAMIAGESSPGEMLDSTAKSPKDELVRIRSRRMATAAFAALLAVSSFGLVTQTAQAATGDGWSGAQVVDVLPPATTQINVIGLMPHYTGGGSDLYL